MIILGISAYYHDSAACLVVNGKITAAAQEERFTRKKHDPDFPRQAISYCLSEAEIKLEQVDWIVFYDKPFLKFERLLETYLSFAPRGLLSFITSMPLWLKDKLFQKHNIVKALSETWGYDEDWERRLLFSEHHLSHAASAFFPSPFDSAAVLTMDGVGEWTTTSLGVGDGNKLSLLKEIRFPHSLGLLYSAFTYYLGFKVNSGEYKVMGLAPYGEPKYVDLITENLIDIKDDGSFFLDMSYFNYCTGLTMTSKKFDILFGAPPRDTESVISKRDMDLAASLQVVTERIVIKLARHAAKITGKKNLCLAGGVALNCVANGALVREKIFDEIWIQPAAGDAGGALGAALAVHHMMHDLPRKISNKLDGMSGSYLGPEYSQTYIEDDLRKCGGNFKTFDSDEIIKRTAHALTIGKVIGWMNGRMEFGPRSLGARSILADPRSLEMQKILNLKIKYRESFRPFAPSILLEDVSEWFDLNIDSPYMLLVAKVAKTKKRQMSYAQEQFFGIEKLNVQRSVIPSVTHVDYSARVQTVSHQTNNKFYQLIKRFKELTGCPILVNTSFNVRGEPIVCTPEDAYNCFMGTEMDILVIGNSWLEKSDQSSILIKDYKDNYELD